MTLPHCPSLCKSCHYQSVHRQIYRHYNLQMLSLEHYDQDQNKSLRERERERERERVKHLSSSSKTIKVQEQSYENNVPN